MFNERLQLRDGRMYVPNRLGLGFSLSEQAIAWTTVTEEFGKRAWLPFSARVRSFPVLDDRATGKMISRSTRTINSPFSL
ncbi:MAG: hypothetical protein CPDRYMAC_4757 [uncultured Paraburkholderia sp.]|nr:MAG: hypothetical protein CPDRYDRY_4671 [uncultured Paraburkholderia sp.]CAH2938005.1 MAG: hypothetical protein CPDRYMAC_4757 [uncultured Paraburkholderia sp.]